MVDFTDSKDRLFVTQSGHLEKGELIRTLNTGGNATVYVYECADVHDEEVGKCEKQFVVKVLNDTENVDELLKREYEMGKHLVHPFILKTLDVDVSAKAIIYENFVGEDMLDFLDINERSVSTVEYLIQNFWRTLCAVEYMHNLGIAHMDIKLENIVVRGGMMKLIDFGYARFFRERTSRQFDCFGRSIELYRTVYSSKVCGTPGYFPPEFYDGLPFRADKVDVWCAGVSLYNIVYDVMPWEYSRASKDPIFRNCEWYFRQGKLSPKYFDRKNASEFNAHDMTVFEEMFKAMFVSDPESRTDIYTLRKMLERSTIIRKMLEM